MLMKRISSVNCDYAGSEAGTLKRHVLGVHDKVRNYKCEQNMQQVDVET